MVRLCVVLLSGRVLPIRITYMSHSRFEQSRTLRFMYLNSSPNNNLYDLVNLMKNIHTARSLSDVFIEFSVDKNNLCELCGLCGVIFLCTPGLKTSRGCSSRVQIHYVNPHAVRW